jgi:hypothetical protein
MDGKFPRSLDENSVDKKQFYLWLKCGDIKGGTESTVVAAQDQALSTNCFKKNVLKEEIESMCRL